MELDERRSLLRSLHVRGNPLVLPNAWDAASALAVVEAGFAAVATSSSAVAESLGYEDGEGAPAEVGGQPAPARAVLRGVGVHDPGRQVRAQGAETAAAAEGGEIRQDRPVPFWPVADERRPP